MARAIVKSLFAVDVRAFDSGDGEEPDACDSGAGMARDRFPRWELKERSPFRQRVDSRRALEEPREDLHVTTPPL